MLALAALLGVMALSLVIVKADSAPSCTAAAFLFTWYCIFERARTTTSTVATSVFALAFLGLMLWELRAKRLKKLK